MNQHLELPLEELATLTIDKAQAMLDARSIPPLECVQQLATAALEHAESEPDKAQHWLDIARSQCGANALEQQAQIAYAQARLHVQVGDLTSAEENLEEAQHLWVASGNQTSLTRSYMGLTQVLTMQGRFGDAETAIRQAIANLEVGAASNPDLLLQLAGAYQNLANLLTRQGRHRLALSAFKLGRHSLEKYHQSVLKIDSEILAHIEYMRSSMLLNEAIALMFLDQPMEAEQKLDSAIQIFNRTDDRLNRGKARSNLGSLYLRLGYYAQALEEFEKALRDLTEGDFVDKQENLLNYWRQADVTPLDQAMAYLALNLLPEATIALERCELFFRGEIEQDVARPYELGQCLYTLGLVRLYSGQVANAKAALDEAYTLFEDLDNRYWLNRTRLALAVLNYESRELILAQQLAEELIKDWEVIDRDTADVKWDSGSLIELLLLRLRIHLDMQELEDARQSATQVQIILDQSTSPLNLLALPHLQLQFQHVLGKIEQATGNHLKAQQHFRQAIDLLDSQRASLPIEEIRTAFLDDKTRIYGNLIISILAISEPNQDSLVEVFNVIERARSRALLERLYATMSEENEDHQEEEGPHLEQRRHIRQRLHWRYNRLLSTEGLAQSQPMQGEPAESEHRTISQAIQADEALLQQLEWQTSSALVEQAQPVDLQAYQKTLAADEQTLIYYIANHELLLLLIDAEHIEIFRNLCDIDSLSNYQNELRFQLGRAELGTDYLKRHAMRLQRSLHSALHDLYQCLIAPLEEKLWATKLHIIPYGSLHQLPFHALWNGNSYLIEHFECTYAPSASIAVHCHGRPQQRHNQLSFAGIALNDVTIPAAQAEVKTVVNHFQKHWLYLDQDVNEDTIREAATQADILHIATHGLFRADNPFFSALKLADGWLDVREIYRLPLRAYLVVLSACESGASLVRGGDELIGLARGFLGAGARQLLVTLWNVNDQSAAQLMDRFYTHLVDDERPQATATALRTAQLEAIAEEQHPYFWAPFFMIGK